MIYRFGDCEFNTHCHTLRHADQLLQPRPKVLRVLTYLLEHADRVVTREELCAEVWPQHHISNATLESTLRAVRQVRFRHHCGRYLATGCHSICRRDIFAE